MPLDQLAPVLALLAVAVAADVALFRWRRRTWQPQRPAGQVERLVIAVDGLYGRGLDRLRRAVAPFGRWWSGLFAVAGANATEPPVPEPAAEAEPPVVSPPATPAPEPAPPNAVATVVSPVQVTHLHTGSEGQWARVNLSVEMPVGATMRVTIVTTPNQAPVVTVDPAAPPARRPAQPRRAPNLRRPAELLAAWLGPRPRAFAAAPARTLFAVALLLYAATRLIGLERYPIYFFTDEAVHTVLARDFVERGFRNSDHELLPTYFSLGPSFNLNGVSVYLQVIPYLLFGPAVAVTRGTSALVSLVAAVAVGLILRDIFRARYWWTATLLLSIAPAWFLHSRTAFEYAEVTAYFAGCLYCYLRYRRDAPRYLYGAVLFGALAFYTHGLGVVLMAATGLLLVASDYRYHWQQRAVVGRALLLTLALALPYLRYTAAHPAAFGAQLAQRGSLWADPNVALGTKILGYLKEYAYGFSPAFWFLPHNGRDLERHVMNGYGNLWWFTLPLLVIGLLLALRRVRDPLYRAVLLALLAAPVGSALVAIGVPRMLWFLIPAAVLMALGLEWLLNWAEARWPRRAAAHLTLSLAALAALGGVNIYMFADALANGGRWTNDYTLYGVQWGAQQLFGEAVPELLAADPDVEVYVSPTWANGADLFTDFFLSRTQRARVAMRGLDYYFDERRALPADYVQIITADEYVRLTADPRAGPVTISRILNYPNGAPGFYFVQIEYAPGADALFAAAEAARRQPVTEPFDLAGDRVTITHPQFGSGQLRDLLDGNDFTLISAPRANPLVLDFELPRPWTLTGLTLITGSMDDFSVQVELFGVGAAEPVTLAETYRQLPPDPTVTISFGAAPVTVNRVRVSVSDTYGGETANIHLRELSFQRAP